MPKLSKIRLTGCKYDGLRKEHENSIFDLTKDNKADHALFTLCNGGGKGVMMQLIFQLLLPETRWGKNGGNKVISMFYDQRNNLHSFTFHVVLEWILDTIPEKRLITGIAIKAISKNTNNEDEEKTGLSYYTYTHEHGNNGYFTVENLPLYNSKNKEAVDIDELEKFIDANKKDFIKYSKTSVKKSDGDYLKYLENRGIYRNEWINLKEINKLEGGAGDYFIGANDNKSIFDKIIIPAISENIKNYSYGEDDNLIEMFRSNLSITRDLPILIKRENDYKELLTEIKPLIDNADIGSRYISMKDRIIDEGNDIYFILKDQYISLENEIEKWKNEIYKSEIEKEDLNYRKENLYYNKQRAEMIKIQETNFSLEKLYNNKLETLNNKKQEKLLYEINKVLNNKNQVEEEINNQIIEKENILKILDLDDIKEKSDEIDNSIEDEWIKNKKIWIEKENQYKAYENYVEKIKGENNYKIKQYEEKISALNRDLTKYQLIEEEYIKKKYKLEEIYDSMSLMFPNRILEDLLKSHEKIIETINKYKIEILDYEKRVSQIEYDIVAKEHILRDKNNLIENLKNQIIEQEKEEINICKKIAKQLIEAQETGLITREWLENKLNKLLSMKKEKVTKLESIQRNIWEKQIDKSLNKDDYFIANKDILQIKSQIDSLNINVETGTEYLKKLNEENKIDILKSNPGFIYGLVIESIKDWNIINKNMDKNILLNNMVPIYIRSEMNKDSSNSFKLIDNKVNNLVDSHIYNNWKAQIEEHMESLYITESNIKNDIANIEEIIQEINILNTKDRVLVLNKKLKEEEGNLSSIMEDLRVKKEEILEINKNMDICKSKLIENQAKYDNISISIRNMEEYIEKLDEVNTNRSISIGIEKEIGELNNNIEILKEDKEQLEESKYKVSIQYSDWTIKRDNLIDQLKDFYKNIDYRYDLFNEQISYRIPDFTLDSSRLESLIREKKAISEDIAKRNHRIDLIDNNLKHLRKDLMKYNESMNKLTKKFSEYEDLGLSLNELEILSNRLEKEIEDLSEEVSNIKSNLDKSSSVIELMIKQLLDKEKIILEKYKKASLVLDIEDMDSALDMVARDLKSNQDYYNISKEELEKNQILKTKVEINLSKIKSGYNLELNKGKIDKILKEKIKENPNIIVEDWIRKYNNIKLNIDSTIEQGEKIVSKFIKQVENKLEENNLKEKIIVTIRDIKVYNFQNNLDSLKSMKNHFENELMRLSKDKGQAEEAMKQWSQRASMHVIRMIEALKSMVASMNYINEQGYAFPLVKLKGVEKLPKEESQVISLLEEYFIQSISKVIDMNLDIANIEEKFLKDLMGDKVIFSKAIQGKYPTLLVYKMSEKNEFRYARARDEYYTTWEAINKGEGDLPEGSGGQTLSVNTFVIMMIMSFKKKYIGNENPSTVLILDNPFGKASAKHVLDPIFEIANKLNFQIISFAAPEIIKVEISERFPVFWELKIENGKVVHGGRILKASY